MQPPFARLPNHIRFDLDGLGLHLLEWPGPEPYGAPLLMLHGWLDQAWTFAWLAQRLPGRLLAWDARGYGRSDRAAAADFYHFFDYLWDLHQLLNRLDCEKIWLLGHSMGGMVASFYAAVYPERVAGLVSLEGWIVPEFPLPQLPGRVREWLDQRSRRGPLRARSLADATARLQRQDPRLSPEQARWLAYTATEGDDDQRFWRYDPRHRMRSPQPFRLDQAQTFWAALDCPRLLLYGEQSEALRLPDWQDRLAAFGPAEIQSIAEAGHNLHLHQPEVIAARVQAWLERHAY